MTPAAVGYQCPDCVQAGRATSRRATTVFGGQLGRDGAVSMTLIALCGVAFVALGVLDLAGGLDRWALQPVAIALGDQWIRLLTAIFLHAGLLHLAFNMYALYLLGPPLERALGHGRFLTLFLVSGLGGSVASYLFSPLLTISVGASGAIFGLMAAWIVVHRRLRADATPVILLLGINVVLGFLVSGIDWRAHLGGAVVGAVVTAILTTGKGAQGRAQTGRQAVLVGLVVIALIALVAWRSQQIQEILVGQLGG
jgi:membrane associated rhomboid family serine protease